MFARTPAQRLRVLLVDRDDVGASAEESTAYVMRSARGRLGGVPSNLRSLSTLRSFSRKTEHSLLLLVVRATFATLQTRR